MRGRRTVPVSNVFEFPTKQYVLSHLLEVFRLCLAVDVRDTSLSCLVCFSECVTVCSRISVCISLVHHAVCSNHEEVCARLSCVCLLCSLMRQNMWKSSSIKSVIIESITLEDGAEEKQEKKCCEARNRSRSSITRKSYLYLITSLKAGEQNRNLGNRHTSTIPSALPTSTRCESFDVTQEWIAQPHL